MCLSPLKCIKYEKKDGDIKMLSDEKLNILFGKATNLTDAYHLMINDIFLRYRQDKQIQSNFLDLLSNCDIDEEGINLFYDNIFLHNPIVDDFEFNVMNKLMNRFDYIHNFNYNESLITLDLLFNPDKFANKNESYIKIFIKSVLNVYVPCESPEIVAEEVVKILVKDTTNPINSIDINLINNLNISIEAKLCLRYIYEIFHSDNKGKKEFFKLYHATVYHEYCYFNSKDIIVNRYFGYFGDETENLVNHILFLFNESNKEGFREYFNSYLEKLPQFFNEQFKDNMDIQNKITRCLINDLYNVYYTVINNIPNDNRNITFEELNQLIDLYQNVNENIATEATKKLSQTMHEGEKKIYKAYKNYKRAEGVVDSQLTKMAQTGKKLLIGDVKKEIIEGKEYTAIGILKKALGTAAIFAFGPIKGIIALVVRYSLKKSTTQSERKKIMLELQAEIEMIEEKIEDARSDGNREAKYALMRTRTELKTAYEKVRLGMEADQRSINTAKNTIKSVRGEK